MKTISKKLGLRLAALTVATVGLSGCVYDMGLGYYDDGYSYYDCDPFSPFDRYYACDSGYGFYNIGFGGGWYDSYWYPGHGYYIFDNYGRRHTMHDRHRRYWGDQRQRWYRDNGRNHDGRGRGHRGGRGDGRGHGYDYNGSPGGVDQPIAWPEQGGGRRSERPGRAAQPAPPPPQAVGGPNWGGERNDDRRGGRGDGRGRGRGRGGWDNGGGQSQGAVAAPPPPQQPVFEQPRQPRGDGGGNGGGRGRGDWQGGGNGAQGGQIAAPPPPPQPRAAPPPAQPRPSPPQERSPDRLPD